VPLLPFDGGHIAVATYEAIRSRKGRRYHADVRKLLEQIYNTHGRAEDLTSFSDEDIWDIGAITAFFGLSNRMANMSGMLPNPEFYPNLAALLIPISILVFVPFKLYEPHVLLGGRELAWRRQPKEGR